MDRKPPEASSSSSSSNEGAQSHKLNCAQANSQRDDISNDNNANEKHARDQQWHQQERLSHLCLVLL
jgi:uncharacterized protein (UPF0147 family)